MWKAIDNVRILTVFGLLLAGAWGRHFPSPRHSQPDYYNDSPNSLTPDGGYRGEIPKDWVKVEIKSPNVVRVPQGGRFILECEASGLPSPSIRWHKGSRTITQFENDFENNDINHSTGLGQVVSKYVVDCALPHHQGIYKCEAGAGSVTRSSESIELLVEGSGSTDLGPICENEVYKPIITLSRPLALVEQGNEVILQCRVHGRPTPKVIWIDKKDNIINSESDPRLKVLYNGDLLISRLRWEDMGKYTCVAKNKFRGEDRADTFLYPLSRE